MEALLVLCGSGLGLVGLCCIKHRKYNEELNRRSQTSPLINSDSDSEDSEDTEIDYESSNHISNTNDDTLEITKDNIDYVNNVLKEYDLCGICYRGYGKDENYIMLDCNHTYHIDCYQPHLKNKICFRCK